MNIRSYRLENVDMLRGLVIVLMALDHVRDYFMAGAAQDPMTDPDVGAALFFTRWITHFCAPVFVFLAGTSAGLMQARRSPAALGSFLFKRGFWLIAVEVFLISTAWTFAPGGIEQMQGLVLIVMQVIWVIGAGMVVLAGLQFLGRRVCLVLGLMIVLGHNTLDPVWPTTNMAWWVALNAQVSFTVGSILLAFSYPLQPWVGVILLGFGSAGLFEEPAERRDRRLVAWGAATTLAFVLLRGFHLYGDPNPWQFQGSAMRTVIDFLNVTKYPPSLHFVLMTLGPMAILAGLASRVPDAIKRPLVTFGKAPFAFYVAHLYLIHALSVGLGVLQGFDARQMLTYITFYPQGFGLGLPGVYAVWLGVVVLLYPMAKWVANVKAQRRDWWLSYV